MKFRYKEYGKVLRPVVPITIKVEAGFIPKIGGGIVPSYGIAGQKGFFDHFVVKFNLSKKEIEVTKRKK